MPELKNTRGIDYFDNIDFKEIIKYSQNPNPICGDCLKSLLFMNDLIHIPILNEVYCNKCGRTNFYKNYFEKGILKY